MPSGMERTPDSRLSELFLLSLIEHIRHVDAESQVDEPDAGEVMAEELRKRLLRTLREHRDEQRPLRYRIVAYESLSDWLLRQSARGLVSLEITDSAPDNPRVRLTEHGREVLAKAPEDLGQILGFAV